MFRYVLEHYPPGTPFLIVDDSVVVVRAAKHLQEKEGKPIKQLLTTVQAAQAGMDTIDTYLQAFAGAFGWPMSLETTLAPNRALSASRKAAAVKLPSFFTRLFGSKSLPTASTPNSSPEKSADSSSPASR